MGLSNNIKTFYETFSRDVLLKDFYNLNLRQQAIIDLCSRFIPNGASILEIGCGVGIISRHLQRRASQVVSVDIGETNIKIAKMYTKSPKVEFKIMDITEDISNLAQYGSFEAILLADVIEHIPKEKRSALFKNIERLLAVNGLVLLTFPSPQYQEYIKLHNPESIQIVDEKIWLSDIIAVTSLSPLYFSYCDAWGKNQYIHLVLSPRIDYSTEKISNVLEKIIYKIRNVLWRCSNAFFLRKVKNTL